MNRFILSRRYHPGTKRPARARPVLELLEDRTVLNSYTAGKVVDLINDISNANLHPGSNTIALVANTAFTLTAVDNTTDNGGNGLPVIAANDNLTIQGNGDTIARSTASGTPAFRLFDVATGASLTLTGLTLANGYVVGYPGMAAFGGGIYSSGSLTLTNATLSSNSARGGDGQQAWDPDFGWYFSSAGASAYGGGLYVADGTATLTNATLSSNSASGGTGNSGGCAYGGGLYVAGGTVTLTNATLSSNTAAGGSGGSGSFGGGGGLYVAGGTVTLTSSTLSSNSAIGGGGTRYGTVGGGGGGALYAAGGTVTLRSDTVTGNSAVAGGKHAPSDGGGLSIDPAATVYLDAFTLKHTKTNKPNDISGSYTLIT